MIFIFNADGTVIKNTPDKIFQGSSKANTIYFISPVPITAVISVGFNLPNNNYTPKYLMTPTEQTGLTGTFDINGNVFNMWELKVPSAITSQAGTVGVQFFINTNGSTAATERVNIPIEQGVYTLEPEDEPGYNEVLEALSVINGLIQNNAEAIEDLNAEKQDKITLSNPLQSDLVSDSGESHKFVTAEEKAQITTNKNNIETLKTTVGDNSSGLIKAVNDNTTEIARIDADYGRYISLLIDSSTYVLTVSLYNNDSILLDSAQVDLPLESMVVSGSYDSTTKSLILTLQSGNTITIPVGDLISGLVPDSRTIAGLDLSANRSKADMLTALGFSITEVTI